MLPTRRPANVQKAGLIARLSKWELCFYKTVAVRMLILALYDSARKRFLRLFCSEISAYLSIYCGLVSHVTFVFIGIIFLYMPPKSALVLQFFFFFAPTKPTLALQSWSHYIRGNTIHFHMLLNELCQCIAL